MSVVHTARPPACTRPAATQTIFVPISLTFYHFRCGFTQLFRTAFRNTVLEAMKQRGWTEAPKSEKDWDFYWADVSPLILLICFWCTTVHAQLPPSPNQPYSPFLTLFPPYLIRFIGSSSSFETEGS